jgi:hypothetical protein
MYHSYNNCTIGKQCVITNIKQARIHEADGLRVPKLVWSSLEIGGSIVVLLGWSCQSLQKQKPYERTQYIIENKDSHFAEPNMLLKIKPVI